MKTLVKISVILNLLLTVSCFSQTVKVYAGIDDSKTIYLGTQFNYNIVVDGTDQNASVDTSPLEQYHFDGPSVRNQSQQSITIINGKRRINETKRYVISYSIHAVAVGKHEIPSLNITVDGKVYQTNPVSFEVLEPEITDQLALEVDLSKDQCYVGESVAITIKWYIALEIARQVGDFAFDIPIFKDNSFVIDDVPGFGDANAKDFEINGVKVKAEQTVVNRNNKQHLLLTFKKVLIPQQIGAYNYPQSRITSQIAVRVKKTRALDSFFDDFLRKEYKVFAALSKPMALQVNPLPDVDKPADYYGLVGEYSIESSAQPTKVKVGDPITLTINVVGESLKPVQWPDLQSIPSFSEGFIIPDEKSTPKYENGQKQFVQTIRAKSESVTEIPAIPLTFFDVKSGKYNTAYSAPIKLEVEYNKTLTVSDIEGLNLDPVNSALKSARNGLSANYEGRWLLEDQRFTLAKAILKPLYLSILSITVVAFIVSFIARLILSRDPEKKKLGLQKNAASKSVRSIKAAAKLPASKAKEKLAQAIRHYLSERFDKHVKAITPHDCQTLFAEFDEVGLATELAQILAACQESEYSPVKVDFDPEWCKNAIEIIQNLETKIKK